MGGPPCQVFGRLLPNQEPSPRGEVNPVGQDGASRGVGGCEASELVSENMLPATDGGAMRVCLREFLGVRASAADPLKGNDTWSRKLHEYRL